MDKTFLIEAVRKKFDLLQPIMNERMRRQWAASEALSLPRGGITLVSQATALSRNTVEAGIFELQTQVDLPLEEVHPERVRRPGGGRHPLLHNDPTLIEDLEALVEPATRGDPQSPPRPGRGVRNANLHPRSLHLGRRCCSTRRRPCTGSTSKSRWFAAASG